MRSSFIVHVCATIATPISPVGMNRLRIWVEHRGNADAGLLSVILIHES